MKYSSETKLTFSFFSKDPTKNRLSKTVFHIGKERTRKLVVRRLGTKKALHLFSEIFSQFSAANLWSRGKDLNLAETRKNLGRCALGCTGSLGRRRRMLASMFSCFFVSFFFFFFAMTGFISSVF